jgi:uncharacterized membrane protein YsdA (DUF1294 family)
VSGGSARPAAGGVTGNAWFLLGALLVLPALAVFRLDAAVRPWVVGGAAGCSLLAVVLHWADKRAAVGGKGRIPESWLHACELLGGWPGAFLAQRAWRHKTSKLAYQAGFWLIVALHELLALDLASDGRVSRMLRVLLAGGFAT